MRAQKPVHLLITTSFAVTPCSNAMLQRTIKTIGGLSTCPSIHPLLLMVGPLCPRHAPWKTIMGSVSFCVGYILLDKITIMYCCWFHRDAVSVQSLQIFRVYFSDMEMALLWQDQCHKHQEGIFGLQKGSANSTAQQKLALEFIVRTA